MKKIVIIMLAALVLLCSCAEKNEAVSSKGSETEQPGETGTGVLSAADPSEIIDAVYAALPEGSKAGRYIPELITSEINENTEEYYLGIKGVKYKKGAASEAFEQPVTYSFCVVIFEDDADYDAERIKIERNINKSKWVCASAEEAFAVRYKNTAAVIMGPKDVCAELETAFLSVVEAMEK